MCLYYSLVSYTITYNPNTGENGKAFNFSENATIKDLYEKLYEIDFTITKSCRIVIGQNEYSFENTWSQTFKQLNFKKRTTIQLAKDVRAA